MSKVKVDISMSLDGCIDAAGVSMEAGLGEGGNVLHEWGDGDEMDELSARAADRCHDVGALICGRRTYDLSVQFWAADGPTGPGQREPTFVLSHSEPDQVPENGVYRFVRGDLEAVLAQARKVAGDRGVSIMGGAHTIQQFLSAGLVDEIHLHLIPVLFGAGTRLLDLDLPAHLTLQQDRVDVSPQVVHLTYRVNEVPA